MRPYRVGSVLFNAEDIVVPMVQARIPHLMEGFGPCVALGVIRNDILIGGVVYHGYRQNDRDIQVSIAFDNPGWAFPATLRTLFSYAFDYAGCIRMTAIIAKSNGKSRAFTEGLGFKLEGVCRKALGGENAMIYGLLVEECRFLRKPDGQATSTDAARAA